VTFFWGVLLSNLVDHPRLVVVRVVIARRCWVPVQVHVRIRVLPHEDEAARRLHGRRRNNLLCEFDVS
jgi:hypothetical protein